MSKKSGGEKSLIMKIGEAIASGFMTLIVERDKPETETTPDKKGRRTGSARGQVTLKGGVKGGR